VTWFWDWYQATVRVPSQDVQVALLSAFPGSWLEEQAVRLGYGEGYSCRDTEGQRARVQAGGRNVWPNIAASSQDAPPIALLLRTDFPEHEVTRFDSAQDFDAPGAWARLTKIALDVADEHRIKVEHAGDWHRGEEGRTLYLGARSSGVRARVYEKGKELRAKRAPNADEVSPDAVRVEVQVRPEGEGRRTASWVPPEAAWGFSKWSLDLAGRVDGTDVPRVQIRDLRASNDARALDFMVQQYGAMLARTAGADGMSWELLGARIARLHARNLARKEQQ
jgi:hypothetical protein